jgi:O-antigen ligase
VSDAPTRLAALAISGAVLFVLLLFVPSLEAPFLVPKFAALEVTASLGLVAFALRRALTGGPRWAGPLTAGALLVLATTAISWMAAAGRSLGAPYAVDAVARWASLFGLACGASVLADAQDARQRVLEVVAATAGLVAAIGLLQHLEVIPLSIPVISTPGSTFGNRNAAAEVMAMASPLTLGAAFGSDRREARWAILASLGLELVFLAVTRTRGAWLGAAFGLGAALLVVRHRPSRISVGITFGVLVAVGIAASVPGRFNPRDSGDRKRYSGVVEVLEEGFDARSTALRTRFGLWRRTVKMIREQPLLGVGPGNWPVVFPRYAEPGATRDGVLSATLAPRQVHNDVLERTAETGIVGLAGLGVLVAGAGLAVARRLRRHQEGDADAAAAGSAGALVALVVVSAASFPCEMPGTIALAGIALGLVAPEPQTGPASSGARSRRLAWAATALGLAMLVCAAVRAERRVRGSRWLAVAERALHRDAGSIGAAEAMGALNYSLAAAPDDYRARLRTAQMLLRERRSAASAGAARQAIALEPYAPNAWAALAASELEAGDPEASRADAAYAITILQDYPFALYVRAQAAERQGDTGAAAADRERLLVLAAGPESNETARTARTLLKPAQ